MTAAAAAAPMQGTYIPQYTPVPPTAVPVEVRPSTRTLYSPIENNVNVVTPDSPTTPTHQPWIHPLLYLLTAPTHRYIH